VWALDGRVVDKFSTVKNSGRSGRGRNYTFRHLSGQSDSNHDRFIPSG
jgi:hypothetical protein